MNLIKDVSILTVLYPDHSFLVCASDIQQLFKLIKIYLCLIGDGTDLRHGGMF